MADNNTSLLFDAMCKISSYGSNVFNYKFIIEDMQTTVNDFPNTMKLIGEEFKIPMKYSVLPCHIQVYPSGATDANEGYMSVFFHAKPSDDMKCKLQDEFAIIDAKGEKKYVQNNLERNISEFKVGRGFREFIKHSDLFDPSKKYLKNGSLTLSFKITIKQDDLVIKSKQLAGNGERVNNDHFSFMEKLLENPENFGSDFIIECANHEEIMCHTSILAANSEVFQGMLAHDSTEKKNGRVEMDDLKKEICQIILRFVYTGCLDGDDITMELYEQSDKLGFLHLKDVCSKHLIQFIEMENCIGTLLVADARDDRGLKDASIECVLDNYDKLADNVENNVTNLKLAHEMLRKMAQRIKLA